MLNLNDHKPSMIIRIWPDGTSVLLDDYCEGDYSHMSDDHTDIDLYDFDACASFYDQALLAQIIEEYMGEDPAIHNG